ncbi:COPI associated protein-domain-containing protein [Zychaea mexicana]|uniref:COPI associated protein-domain-containing protein n=1 Tax=Zychaea mexicana TaxID=64656 RepID=UPI0022FEC04E|nr:COPI associated protein-domain-containing protein [Zychaea mexicana]KAI9488115.1 COPI associated protein-domain-containing protein [Zychaea mexicana]
MDRVMDSIRNVNHSLVFRIINIIVACFMIIGGVCTIITGGFPQFIRGIYCIVFGVVVFLFEFRLPSIITQHASFLFSFIGRGIFYIFIGCIILNYLPLAIASGVIVAVFGVAYVILQFIPGIEAPSNMKRQALDDSMDGGGGSSGGRAAQWAAANDQPYGSPTNYGPSAADTGYTANVSHNSTSVV